MKKIFIPLIEKQKLFNGFRQVFSVKKMKLLLVHLNNKTFLLENKCGHFGLALDDAKIEQHQGSDVIICIQHGISFDLSTGQVVNRPWENCDPIKIIDCVSEEDKIGFYL